MTETTTIIGKVTFEKDVKQVFGVQVFLERDGMERMMAKTELSGAYQFTNVPYGDYVITGVKNTPGFQLAGKITITVSKIPIEYELPLERI